MRYMVHPPAALIGYYSVAYSAISRWRLGNSELHADVSWSKTLPSAPMGLRCHRMSTRRLRTAALAPATCGLAQFNGAVEFVCLSLCGGLTRRGWGCRLNR